VQDSLLIHSAHLYILQLHHGILYLLTIIVIALNRRKEGKYRKLKENAGKRKSPENTNYRQQTIINYDKIYRDIIKTDNKQD